MIATSNFRSLARREKLFLGAGAAAVTLFVFTMLPGGGDEQASVELAATPPAAPPPPEAAPAPVVAPSPPTVSTEGLVLTGVFGGGPRGGSAIFALPTGQARRVPIGRDVLPGLALKSVGLSHAVLAGAGGDMRFEIGRSGATPSEDGSAGSALPRGDAQSLRRETIQYRLGLQPVRSNGRAAGYALKAGAEMPRLQRAGLQAGDVIVAVNGSRFDEERMLELSWQASNSASTEVEFIRNGRTMKVNIGPGQ